MWIREYRERIGLELDELARVVNLYRRYAGEPINGFVSNALIHLLEVNEHTVTHPVLANAIATVCGATSEERDSIVHKSNRGTWVPDETRTRFVERALTKVMGAHPEKPPQVKPVQVQPNVNLGYGPRPVVKLDRTGNTIQRYESIGSAARDNGLDQKWVRRRCDHRIRNPEAMFTPSGHTFRYAAIWDQMSQTQKLNDIRGIW